MAVIDQRITKSYEGKKKQHNSLLLYFLLLQSESYPLFQVSVVPWVFKPSFVPTKWSLEHPFNSRREGLVYNRINKLSLLLRESGGWAYSCCSESKQNTLMGLWTATDLAEKDTEDQAMFSIKLSDTGKR